MATFRTIVRDVEEAAAFYAGHLGFAVELDAAPGFAALRRDDLRLLLSAAEGPGGGSQPLHDGRRPEPGGWNRIQLEVDDVEAARTRLWAAGARVRSDVVTGRGGRQLLVEDPSGNPVELFEPAG